MKRTIVFLYLAICVIMGSAQKIEKIKYEGFYNNLPIMQIGEKGYHIRYSLAPSAKTEIEKGALQPIKIQGLTEGDDFPIVIFIGDPTVSVNVETVSNTVNNQIVNSYFNRLTISCDAEAIIMNKEGLPLHTIVPVLTSFYTQNDGFTKSNRQEVEAESAAFLKKNEAFGKGNIIQGIYKYFEQELNNRLGQFVKTASFRISGIESKKFDYTDFNSATIAFQKATETADINSPDNKKVIENAIEVWSRYASEFQADKKAKVNDDNIDEIYFNIAMAYLVLGDGEHLKTNWEKCLSIKGNTGPENYANQYVSVSLFGHDNSITDTNLASSKSLVSKELQMSNMIVLNGIINHYLTGKQGNLAIMVNYFPARYTLISQFSSQRVFSESTTEKYSIQYAPFGKISQLQYNVEGGIGDEKKLSLRFVNGEFGVTEIYKNENKLLFTMSYKDGQLSEVNYLPNSSTQVKYTLDYSTPHEIVFNLTMITNGVAKAEKTNTSLTYDDQFNITAMRLAPYSFYNGKYDDNGNLIEMGASDAADNTVKIIYNHELDSKGNAIHSTMQGISQKNEIEYLF